MQVTKTRYQLKVYPYGGFSVTRAKETAVLVPKVYSEGWKVERTRLKARGGNLSGVCLDFQTEYKYPSDLGLSSALNSHRQPKARRGLKGFSSANKHRIKSASYLLQQKHGRKNLSFLTVTLPPRFAGGHYELNANLIRQFVQSLKRLCERRGVWDGICGVCEIQSERFEREKECALHWHLVFLGKAPWKTWTVSADELRELWRRALSAAFGVTVPSEEVLAAVDVQRIKKNVSNYLGKYLSKGSSLIQDVVVVCGSDVIPTSWIVCSHELKRYVDVSIVRRVGDSASFALDVLTNHGDGLLKYGKHLFHSCNDGFNIWIAFYGTLTEEGNSFCRELPS